MRYSAFKKYLAIRRADREFYAEGSVLGWEEGSSEGLSEGAGVSEGSVLGWEEGSSEG